MICPFYLLAQSNSKDPYLILKQTISFGELHNQVLACERQLLSHPSHHPLLSTLPILL